MTHDIFSMIAIHSALLGPQAPQTKFEYVRDAIRTYNKDLHSKTLTPGISFPARYASRTSGMSSSVVMIACVASVSVLFRSKERPRNEILGFGRARNETRAKK